LSWKREAGKTLAPSGSGKHNTVLVELLEGNLEVFERTLGDNISTGDVAELQEGRECSEDVWGDVPLDSIQIDLHGERCIRETLSDRATIKYLHQRLGVIPSPLVKVSPLFKASQTWKWGSKRNSVK
jgi:hypothetical protein